MWFAVRKEYIYIYETERETYKHIKYKYIKYKDIFVYFINSIYIKYLCLYKYKIYIFCQGNSIRENLYLIKSGKSSILDISLQVGNRNIMVWCPKTKED